MRHSSGWRTLISISFFMRSLSGTLAVCGVSVRSVSGVLDEFGALPARWADRIPDEPVATGRPPVTATGPLRIPGVGQSSGQLHVRSRQDGSPIQEVAKTQGLEQFLGTGRASRGDLEAGPQRP